MKANARLLHDRISDITSRLRPGCEHRLDFASLVLGFRFAVPLLLPLPSLGLTALASQVSESLSLPFQLIPPPVIVIAPRNVHSQLLLLLSATGESLLPLHFATRTPNTSCLFRSSRKQCASLFVLLFLASPLFLLFFLLSAECVLTC